MNIKGSAICWSCKLDALAWFNVLRYSPRRPPLSTPLQNATSHSLFSYRPAIINRQPRRSLHSTRSSQFPSSSHHGSLPSDSAFTLQPSSRQSSKSEDVEAAVRAAREQYGDGLPEGLLSQEQHNLYVRLYGPPLTRAEDAEIDSSLDEVDMTEELNGTLLQNGSVGLSDQPRLVEDSGQSERYQRRRRKEGPAANLGLERDIAATLEELEEHSATAGDALDQADGFGQHDLIEGDKEWVEEDVEGDSTQRSHPFTVAARSGANGTTLQLPKHTFVDPIAGILADTSNVHIDEASANIFGGVGLPYGPGTPNVSRVMPQKPIPLSASHSRMSSIEADAYLAAVMPGTYAGAASILAEVRKRMGGDWLQSLLAKDQGPKILDIGGGGVGVLACREVLTAEWCRIHSLDPEDMPGASPVPLGRGTVVVGSNALRERCAQLLDNTTFLPRLPDYVHVTSDSSTERKSFDIIIASHSLWNLQEPWERKQRVLNLWSMLSKDGGVLILMEKGVPRGFEVIADSRQYLLDELFEKPEEQEMARLEDTEEHEHIKKMRREPAHLIAPCPHAFQCPLYRIQGQSHQRKDYCRFRQRYIRPPFYQRLLGAKHRNHDDVEFSYVAVQKGRSLPDSVAEGSAASERAFQGYSADDEDLPLASLPVKQPDMDNTTPARIVPTDYRLPRVIIDPLKRHGHVHLDLCTPSGTFERWTVPKSYGKQPFRDARKAKWGDLWALGAKQREMRRVRLGKDPSSAAKGAFDVKGLTSPRNAKKDKETRTVRQRKR